MNDTDNLGSFLTHVDLPCYCEQEDEQVGTPFQPFLPFLSHKRELCSVKWSAGLLAAHMSELSSFEGQANLRKPFFIEPFASTRVATSSDKCSK